MGIHVEVDFDTADEITRLTLVDVYKSMANSTGTIADVPLWDALSEVIAYFSTREQLMELEDFEIPTDWMVTLLEYDRQKRSVFNAQD